MSCKVTDKAEVIRGYKGSDPRVIIQNKLYMIIKEVPSKAPGWTLMTVTRETKKFSFAINEQGYHSSLNEVSAIQ